MNTSLPLLPLLPSSLSPLGSEGDQEKVGRRRGFGCLKECGFSHGLQTASSGSAFPPSHVSPCRTLEAWRQQESAGPSKHGLREQVQAWVSEGHSPSPSPQPSKFRLWVSSLWPPCDYSGDTNTGRGRAADTLAAAAFLFLPSLRGAQRVPGDGLC